MALSLLVGTGGIAVTGERYNGGQVNMGGNRFSVQVQNLQNISDTECVFAGWGFLHRMSIELEQKKKNLGAHSSLGREHTSYYFSALFSQCLPLYSVICLLCAISDC
jgi:hypothetical protein